MIAPKVSLESYIVPQSLRWEFIILHHFVGIWVLPRVVIDVLDLLVQLAFEHAHRLHRVLEHVLGKVLAGSAQIVEVDFESVVFSGDEVVYFFSDFSSVEVVGNVRLYLILCNF